MSTNDLKSEFSLAYVRAVAHTAGYFVQEAQRAIDGDGVDLTILKRGKGGVVRSPRLDIQVKATAAAIDRRKKRFQYDLAAKNHDELRDENWQNPRILVVVVVPKDQKQWLSATETELVMRYCGYWATFRGEKASTNATSVRVSLEREEEKRFHTAQLSAIMTRIRDGRLP